MIIAFIGNDGSGKTTLAKSLRSELERVGLKARYRHEFQYHYLKYLIRILGAWFERRREAALKRTQVCPRHGKLWALLVWMDCLIGWIWYRYFKRREITIMDRYAYDFLMSWEWLGYSNGMIRWLYKHFPKPDLVFVCEAPPQVCMRRKVEDHDYDIEFYTVQSTRYQELASELGLECLKTDNAGDDTLKVTMSRVRDLLMSRYSATDRALCHILFHTLGSSTTKLDLARSDFRSILVRGARNQVECRLAHNTLTHHGENLPKVQRKLLERVLDRCLMSKHRFIATLTILRDAFAERDINFLLVKTDLSAFSVPDDIDILVPPGHLSDATDILRTYFHDEQRHLIHRAVEFKDELHHVVDLHTELSWNKQVVYQFTELFGERTPTRLEGVDVFEPSREHAFEILILHSVLQHHYTILGDALKIVDFVEHNGVPEFQSRFLQENLGNVLRLISALRFQVWIWSGRIPSKRRMDGPLIRKVPTADIVTWHNAVLIPKASLWQVVDCVIWIYRHCRYRLNGILPYHEGGMPVCED